MNKQMYRVYRRDTGYLRNRKWELRAAFVSLEDAGGYMQNKIDAIPCDVINIEWKIMKANRNVKWTARCK